MGQNPPDHCLLARTGNLEYQNLRNRFAWQGDTFMTESLNARLRKAARNRVAFPSEQAALKNALLAIRTMTRPDGAIGITRSNGWKATLNAFAIQFGDRININK
jgi:transposase-like protein